MEVHVSQRKPRHDGTEQLCRANPGSRVAKNESVDSDFMSQFTQVNNFTRELSELDSDFEFILEASRLESTDSVAIANLT